MCGITGIIDLKGRSVSKEALSKMTKAVSHRGPDDEGIEIIEPSVGFGHRRLSILDISPAGHQPMTDGRYWLTFNGEIYNYLELKKELEGEYKTTTDSEVLLKAYEKWGAECVQRFNGIFAFAIWDTKEKTLFAVRDHVGVKPFHYAVHGDVFYFASEIKAILAGGFPTKPNEKIIYEYLAHGVYDHSAETFFDGIMQIPAGHSLTIKNGHVTVTPFWKLSDRVWNTEGWSDEKTENTFKEL